MISYVMKPRNLAPRILTLSLALLFAAMPALADKKPKDTLQKPIAGPRATALRATALYVAPDPGSQRVDRVQIGPRNGSS